MTKDPRVYLAHILECIERIERFTRGGREDFFREVLIQDAVIRNVEIIGEAAKRVDDDYRATHPQIPWRGMTALRDVLIHQYEGVELGKVWAVVERNLPQLKQAIKEILPPLEQLERELAGETGDAIC
jgi:uncharacterized protein with HEPN domain